VQEEIQQGIDRIVIPRLAEVERISFEYDTARRLSEDVLFARERAVSFGQELDALERGRRQDPAARGAWIRGLDDL